MGFALGLRAAELIVPVRFSLAGVGMEAGFGPGVALAAWIAVFVTEMVPGIDCLLPRRISFSYSDPSIDSSLAWLQSLSPPHHRIAEGRQHRKRGLLLLGFHPPQLFGYGLNCRFRFLVAEHRGRE